MSELKQEKLLKFPCQFPLKIVGINSIDFQSSIGNAIHELVSDFSPETITVNQSKTGKYLSLTAVINARSKAQLDSVYHMLTSHPMVKFVL